MEKIYQSIGVDGLQIPIALMRQYGLEQGSNVILELGDDGIRILPAQPDRYSIENQAMRYLLANVGDAVTINVEPLSKDDGWQVQVYGLSQTQSAGTLFYASTGILLPERSTPPEEIRQSLSDAPPQS